MASNDETEIIYQRILEGKEAEQLMAMPAFHKIFDRVRQRIDDSLDAVSIGENPEMALEIIRQKQNLTALRREIITMIERGESAQDYLDEQLEQQQEQDEMVNREFTRD